MNRFNRLIHFCNKKGGVIAKILSRMIRVYYHCDIPIAVDIRGVYFCHKGFGIVINPNAQIGEGTVIQHRVTIGEIDGCSPIIGRNCYIGAGAIIIGGITIGDNVKIGAGAVVVTDIPANTTAVGVPAKVIKKVENFSL